MSGIEDREVPRLTRRAALAQGGRRPRRGQLAAGPAGGLWKLELVLIVGVSVVVRSSSSAAAAGSMTGTLTLLTYPDWYGPNEFSDFEKLHPGLTVKTAVSGTTGAAAQIAQISTNPGAFDVTLAGVPVSSQMKLAGMLEPLDTAAIPNLGWSGPRSARRSRSGSRPTSARPATATART